MAESLNLCLACGARKDPAVPELYPYPGDGVVTDRPLRPLYELDCEPAVDGAPWRRVAVCHHCLHRLQPDMWISEACWAALDPVTPFAELPPAPVEET